MKLCQVVYTGFGGLGSVAFTLVAGTPAPAVQWAIAFIGDQPLEPTYAARCEALGIEYEEFRIIRKRRSVAWRQLAGWLDRIAPDAVICHSITSIFAAWWYTRRRSAKLIAVEHTANQIKSRNERLASLGAMLLADNVVLLTNEYRAELQDSLGIWYRPAKVRVIPNGIDVDVFSPGRWESELPTFRLGMAGRFSFSKRQDLLVEVVERLHEICPDITFELTFAGDGDELERVKRKASISPVHTRIRFEGYLDESQLAEWFRNLNLYVHATDGETLSTALLQAMAAGLPIVASDVPGVANLFSEQTSGCCVANDVNTFANVIVRLTLDVEGRRSMGNIGRALAVDRYSVEQMSRSYLSLCEAPHSTAESLRDIAS